MFNETRNQVTRMIRDSLAEFRDTHGLCRRLGIHQYEYVDVGKKLAEINARCDEINIKISRIHKYLDVHEGSVKLEKTRLR